MKSEKASNGGPDSDPGFPGQFHESDHFVSYVFPVKHTKMMVVVTFAGNLGDLLEAQVVRIRLRRSYLMGTKINTIFLASYLAKRYF